MAWLTFTAVMFLFVQSCTPNSTSPTLPPAATGPASNLYIFRVNPSALLELSSDLKVLRTLPISIPAECTVSSINSSAYSVWVALELGCPVGQTVIWMNTQTGTMKQAFTDSDSHFLAWSSDGGAAYLKVDSLVHPHIIRARPDGSEKFVPITEFTYDLAPRPGSVDFLFSFSRGMGQGSEMWLAKADGGEVGQVAADPKSYLSFARWSPDARQIAFIKIPDSPIPYTIGELWIMNSDGSDSHKLADADAGHGFAPAWSPDGKQLAYVVRENPTDPVADQSSSALISNIYLVDVGGGGTRKLTTLDQSRVGAPVWFPDGKKIAFSATRDDKMNMYFAISISGAVQAVLSEPTCCAIWVESASP